MSNRKIDIARFVVGNKAFSKFVERSIVDLLARTPHQIEIKMQIVQRDQAEPKNFFRFNKMPDVTTRKLATRIAAAIFFDWPFIECELGIF